MRHRTYKRDEKYKRHNIGNIINLHATWLQKGFPQRLENLEDESGHGKVMESEKLVKKSWNMKSHGICYQL